MQRVALLSFVLAAVSQVSAQAAQWAQCGGQGWTGATTCVSGSTCVKSNDYYSQCIPGASAPTSTSGGSNPGTTSSPNPSGGSAPLPYVGGVNMAGYDFTVKTDGSFSGTGVSPPSWQFQHFASQGVNIFRVPFAWQLMTPSLGGNIDQNFLSKYDATVQQGLATGAYVIIDLHNYARWNGQIINSGGPTIAQYSSLWTQLAKKYAGNSKIIFGIMNEPHDMGSISSWKDAVQGAVNAIRAAGATSQVILIPGSSYSSAQALPSEAGPTLLGVTDPAGGKNKLVFDVHKYLDSDSSGTHTECVTNNVDILNTLVNWLKQNGRQALLSETGGGNTQSCVTNVGQELAFVKSHSDTIIGFTMWSAGSFDSSYELTLTPPSQSSDTLLWTQAVKPYLP